MVQNPGVELDLYMCTEKKRNFVKAFSAIQYWKSMYYLIAAETTLLSTLNIINTRGKELLLSK